MTPKRANTRRATHPVTVDPRSPDAGRGGVVPPEATRFKPGQSGNPKGRPKGAVTSTERVLEQELERLVEGDPSLGDVGPITRRRRLVRALLAAIEHGDVRAAKPILDRIWPAPATKEQPKQALHLHFDAQDADA